MLVFRFSRPIGLAFCRSGKRLWKAMISHTLPLKLKCQVTYICVSSVVASFSFFFLITVRPGRKLERWNEAQLHQRIAQLFDTKEATQKLASKILNREEYSELASSGVFCTGFIPNRWRNRKAVNWRLVAQDVLNQSSHKGLNALLAAVEESKPGATRSIKEWLTEHSGETCVLVFFLCHRLFL